MTQEAYKSSVRWRDRPESTHACAIRLAYMLAGLAAAHPAFLRWNKKANSRAAANRRAWTMPPDIDELTAVFEHGRQYREVPREPWPELGYSIGAWNGREPPNGASLRVHAGSYSSHHMFFSNSVELEFNRSGPGGTDFASSVVLKSALLGVVAAWEPDYGNLVCWEYWQRLFGHGPYPLFRAGWMTYLAPQYASRITPPPAAIVEPGPGGGMLLLATEERFSMDNPAHLAVADAIQRALEPLQDMVAPTDPHQRSSL